MTLLLQTKMNKFIMFEKKERIVKFFCCSAIVTLFFFIYSLNVNAQVTCTYPPSYTPLSELEKRYYKGSQGGLYKPGSNSMPFMHEEKGQAIADSISPINSAGVVDNDNGKIILVSIGSTDTNQEFSEGAKKGNVGVPFMKLVLQNKKVNSKLLFVNGAANDASIKEWANNQDMKAWGPQSNLRVNLRKVPDYNVKQVQVAWVKMDVNASSVKGMNFPEHAQWFKGQLIKVLQNLKKEFPNLQMAYISSVTRPNTPSQATVTAPEPYAYESGFGIKWLIEEQINGSIELNYDARKGVVKTPWISWGPYLWADTVVKRADKFTWECNDTTDDFERPSGNGVTKIAKKLFDFLSSDRTANIWFLEDLRVNDKIKEYRFEPYTDISGNIFEKYILDLYERLAFVDYLDHTFKLDVNVDRGQMARYIAEGFNIPFKTNCSKFPDVSESNEYHLDIMSLKCNGLVSGFKDGTYRPSDFVTRGQATKFIVTALKYRGISVNPNLPSTYPDVPQENVYRPFISFLSSKTVNGEYIIKGFSDKSFRPDQVLTRGEMSKIIDLSMLLADSTIVV